jgi:hypothetical protein
VRLLAPRPLELQLEGGVVAFSCQKKRWRFAGAALPILRRLAEGRVCSIAELCEAANEERLDNATTRVFLSELLRHGLIAVVANTD